MPRVLVTPAVYRDGHGPWRQVLEDAGFEIVIPPVNCMQISSADFLEHLKGIDGTLAGIEQYNREVFAGSKLKVVARIGVGYDAVDVQAATEHGVVVAITPGTNEHSVAEQAIALITAVFRDTARRDREIRAGQWRRDCPRRLAGNTIGLLGLGRIGRAIIPRCQGLGLQVVGYDPFAKPGLAAELGIRLGTFDEIISQADIVSLHMPCTAETTNLINAATLGRMKPGAVLINTSRGGLVDEDALVASLTAGHLSGAGLDVCKVEPLPSDSPLRALDNVVFSPHLGGIDQTALDAMGIVAAECVVDVLSGRWPESCIVNPKVRPAST
ncbi:MAG: phosphoglycerate dehydrogenase [Planctomycetota bacterium]|nr:phosphoglycerate dehydrogenase [Planctomycetota bacterium]